MTLIGKNQNTYVQAPVSGSIDELIETLRNDFGRPLPGADLLLSNVYDELLLQVTDIKDLGSGVINGTECDHLAFRTDDVDWQIWIARGSEPYPCRYTVATRDLEGQPQYSIDLSNWGAGGEMVTTKFFKSAIPPGAMKVSASDIEGANVLPAHMRQGN